MGRMEVDRLRLAAHPSHMTWCMHETLVERLHPIQRPLHRQIHRSPLAEPQHPHVEP